MAGLALRNDEHFTWADYRSWDDNERWELIGGEAFNMTPAPLTRHQRVSMELSALMERFFKGRKCMPFAAPTDVRLSDVDVVQPDIFVVCNPAQVKPTHIEGPPTLVAEILSPSSVVHDHVRKFQLYARCGVQEYWIVTPYPALIEVYVLDGDHFRLAAGYEKDDTLRSPTFPELEMPLADVFDFPLEPGEEIMVIKEARAPYLPGPRATPTED